MPKPMVFSSLTDLVIQTRAMKWRHSHIKKTFVGTRSGCRSIQHGWWRQEINNRRSIFWFKFSSGMRGVLAGFNDVHHHTCLRTSATIPVNYKRLIRDFNCNCEYSVITTPRLFNSFGDSKATVNIINTMSWLKRWKPKTKWSKISRRVLMKSNRYSYRY